MMTEWLQYLEP